MNTLSMDLKKILFDVFSVDIKERDFDKLLLSSEIGLCPRDLLYLLIEIEKKFDVNLTSDDISNGCLKTFNNILIVLSKKLKDRKDVII